MNIDQIKNVFNDFLQINTRFAYSPVISFNPAEAGFIIKDLKLISKDIEKELPLFSQKLNSLKDTLFVNGYSDFRINPFVFGQVFEILSILTNIENTDRWSLIHPKISNVSKSLYLDGHYANAAEDAFIAINERVKGLFQILRPQDKVPDGDTAMTTVFSPNNPLVEFCDNSSETGKNIQKGFMQMLSGAMSALRNPKAHANIKLSADDAMRQLMFASMLMYKIDEAVTYSNIQEP